jgi:cell division protein FtsB
MTSSRPGPRRADSERALPAPGMSRRRWTQYVLGFLTVLLVVNAVIGERGLIEAWRMREEHLALEGSIKGIQRDNARLTDAVRRYKQDPKTIEEAARRYLGLMRPGEVLFIVKDVPSPGKPTGAAPSPPATQAAPAKQAAAATQATSGTSAAPPATQAAPSGPAPAAAPQSRPAKRPTGVSDSPAGRPGN